MAKTPIAKVVLIKSGDCWLWRMPFCPLCGREHHHGGGPTTGDPRRMLGYRVSHCTELGGRYELVERKPE
jgi:hypothetical protein